MRAVLPGSGLILLALLPLAASGQPWQAFAAQSSRCRQSGAAQDCRLALQQSHALKAWAENHNLLACYTAILGAEAEMLAASLTPGAGSLSSEASQDMNRACGR